MSESDGSRLATELELLEAMYPDQVSYNPKSQDFKFTAQSALLHLRLPELYPSTGLPDVLAAHDLSKTDVRDRVKSAYEQLGLIKGEEALDAIVACFQTLIEESETNSTADVNSPDTDKHLATAPESYKTVIIWLHHLLALSKRKLALAPAASVSGITKPGYPGVMVFTGPTDAVIDHVNTLKAENWQAFQVRYEADERWEFEHRGVVEVGTMSEVVTAVEVSGRKQQFLEAVGIK